MFRPDTNHVTSETTYILLLYCASSLDAGNVWLACLLYTQKHQETRRGYLDLSMNETLEAILGWYAGGGLRYEDPRKAGKGAGQGGEEFVGGSLANGAGVGA
ncbi:hypothetical protein BJY01DRAFT_216023 [Aspergillus pseudoustus]|uniref:Uncharacterized protein n=1 Tax=Aspergillus pseudoustus TaxID=1810923 RepID=A0ABR4JSV0_9EURO